MVLAKAATFADCMNRQLLLNEEGSLVVEDAVATIMGSLAQFSVADLVEEQSVTSYVNQIVESDCSSVQTSIDSATSADVFSDYLNVALMENIHAFDSAQTSTANRRRLGVVYTGIRVGIMIAMYANHQNQHHGHGNLVCDVINGFPADVRDQVIAQLGYTFCNGRRNLDWSTDHTVPVALFNQGGGSTDFICIVINSFPVDLRVSVISQLGYWHCLYYFMNGRRALSENVISIAPNDVLMGCALGAPSEICSLGLSGLAEDFMMTLCGGASDISACEVSSESMHAAIAQLEGTN